VQRYISEKSTVTVMYGDIDTVSTTLNIGATNTNTINIITGSTSQVVNVETSSKPTTINLSSADTVNIAGTHIYINTSNLEIFNNTITINESGGTGSAGRSEINVQEGSNTAGYVKVPAVLIPL